MKNDNAPRARCDAHDRAAKLVEALNQTRADLAKFAVDANYTATIVPWLDRIDAALALARTNTMAAPVHNETIKCPLCNGLGVAMGYGFSNRWITCPRCFGGRVIPKPSTRKSADLELQARQARCCCSDWFSRAVAIAKAEENASAEKGGDIGPLNERETNAFWNGHWAAAHNIAHDLEELARENTKSSQPGQ